MSEQKWTTTLSLDETTRKLLDEFSQKNAISRSGAIRLIINQFFQKTKGIIEGNNND